MPEIAVEQSRIDRLVDAIFSLTSEKLVVTKFNYC